MLTDGNVLMTYFNRRCGARLLIGGAALLLASLAHAQYAWIDEKGLKQFSDRAPPPSTPPSKILKAPGRPVDSLPVTDTPAPATATASAPAPASDSAASKPKGPPTLAERNADFRKRGKEQAEREQQAADEARKKTENSENCAGALQAKVQLESGVRLNTVDKNGERSLVSDEERAQRIARANRALAACR
jgi:hypothetical protein